MERFLLKIRKEDGHWLWASPINPNGYGYFLLSGRSMTAHRAAHILFIGPIPAGLVVDHVKARGCGIKHCVNPAHLEAITQAENFRRGLGPEAVAASNRKRGDAMTHCRQGHAYTPGNTKYEPRKGNRLPSRRCIACQRDGYLRRKGDHSGAP